MVCLRLIYVHIVEDLGRYLSRGSRQAEVVLYPVKHIALAFIAMTRASFWSSG